MSFFNYFLLVGESAFVSSSADQVSYPQWIKLLLTSKSPYVNFLIPIARDILSRNLTWPFKYFWIHSINFFTGLIVGKIINSYQGVNPNNLLLGIRINSYWDQFAISLLCSFILGGILLNIVINIGIRLLIWTLLNPLSEYSYFKFFASLFCQKYLVNLLITYIRQVSFIHFVNLYFRIKFRCKTYWNWLFTRDRWLDNELIIHENLNEIGILNILDSEDCKFNFNDESILILRLIIKHYEELTNGLSFRKLTRFVLKGTEGNEDRYLPIPIFLDNELILNDGKDAKRLLDMRIQGSNLIINILFDYTDSTKIKDYITSELEDKHMLICKHIAWVYERFRLCSDYKDQDEEMKRFVKEIWSKVIGKLIRGNIMLFQLHTFAVSHPDKFDDYFDPEMMRCDHDTWSYRFSAWRRYNLNNFDNLTTFINSSWINQIRYVNPFTIISDIYSYHCREGDIKGWKNKNINHIDYMRALISSNSNYRVIGTMIKKDSIDTINDSMDPFDNNMCIHLPVFELRSSDVNALDKYGDDDAMVFVVSIE